MNTLSSAANAKTFHEKLRLDTEKLLNDLQLLSLTSDEWNDILHVYSPRYWKFLADLVSDLRKDGNCPEVKLDGAPQGDLRADINHLLNTLNLAPLPDREWFDVLLAFSERKWRFINSLIGEVRGAEHFRDVEAAGRRERAKDLECGEFDCSISRQDVLEYCEDNGVAALSDEEMENVFQIIREDFDRYDVIGKAVDCLRSNAGCHSS